MYFNNAIIHFRRLQVDSFNHIDRGLFKETYSCDLTTSSVLEQHRQYGNRPYDSGDYLGVSTSMDRFGNLPQDCYVFSKLEPDELQLNSGRFQNFDPTCYDNRLSFVADVLTPLGDLIDKDHLTSFVNWFHERTRGTSDKWNLSIDFTRDPNAMDIQVILSFFTSNPQLAVLLRLEQAC